LQWETTGISAQRVQIVTDSTGRTVPGSSNSPATAHRITASRTGDKNIILKYIQLTDKPRILRLRVNILA
jgi:hypothetical protein